MSHRNSSQPYTNSGRQNWGLLRHKRKVYSLGNRYQGHLNWFLTIRPNLRPRAITTLLPPTYASVFPAVQVFLLSNILLRRSFSIHFRRHSFQTPSYFTAVFLSRALSTTQASNLTLADLDLIQLVANAPLITVSNHGYADLPRTCSNNTCPPP